MKLQVALDTLSLEECIQLLDEIKDSIEVIEVGTPFIIEEGMLPVKTLKEKYPQLEVLADCKIMDAGEFEATKCFEAGADIVTVLGVSIMQLLKALLEVPKNMEKSAWLI